MKIEYKTVSGTTSQDLDAEVESLIQQGFQPYGNPYSAQRGGDPALFQAMVREPKSTAQNNLGVM